MKQSDTAPGRLWQAGGQVPSGVELRHLRYLVALADAGTFTRAAERMFIAQPTLSQQIQRLEKLVGTPLLQRRREGVRFTTAGEMLLETARDVLALVDWGMNRTRQAAGLGRQRLRMAVPPGLPDALAVGAAAAVRTAAGAAEVDVVWVETPLDAEFSLIRQHRADAGLGWLTNGPEGLAAELDVMSIGEFEPDVWVPASHPAANRGTITLGELARMKVIHGPRRITAGTYDAWSLIIREAEPRFEFTDPPFQHSLPVVLAFAAASDRPAAVLTGPSIAAGAGIEPPWATWPPSPSDMARVGLEGRPLTATAALVWNGDLPAPVQQLLFDAAEVCGLAGGAGAAPDCPPHGGWHAPADVTAATVTPLPTAAALRAKSLAEPARAGNW